MLESGMRCDFCKTFFPKKKDAHPEIAGIWFGIHDNLILDYDHPEERGKHICYNCIYQLETIFSRGGGMTEVRRRKNG